MGRNAVETLVRVGRKTRDLGVLAAGLYFPAGLPWFLLPLIDSLAERDALEQLGHDGSHVCWERWDAATRVEGPTRQATSMESRFLTRVGAEDHGRRSCTKHPNRFARLLRFHRTPSLQRPSEISSPAGLDIVIPVTRFQRA